MGQPLPRALWLHQSGLPWHGRWDTLAACRCWYLGWSCIESHPDSLEVEHHWRSFEKFVGFIVLLGFFSLGKSYIFHRFFSEFAFFSVFVWIVFDSLEYSLGILGSFLLRASQPGFWHSKKKARDANPSYSPVPHNQCNARFQILPVQLSHFPYTILAIAYCQSPVPTVPQTHKAPLRVLCQVHSAAGAQEAEPVLSTSGWAKGKPLSWAFVNLKMLLIQYVRPL